MSSDTKVYTYNIAAVGSNSLAYTNCVYLNIKDYNSIVSNNNEIIYIQLSDGMIYILKSDSSIQLGELAFNKYQRVVSNLSTGLKVNFVFWSPKNKDIHLSTLRLQVDVLAKQKADLEEDDLIKFVQDTMNLQIFTKKQEFIIDFRTITLKLVVADLDVARLASDSTTELNCGLIMSQTKITVEPLTPNNKYLTVKRSQNSSKDNMFAPNFKFEDMGIGGLDREFGDIFRRAFASRTFPPALIKKLGIRHVKGILLYGPPGTGKTLIAREIGKMLNGREPKIVNGPEILNKFVGASEENIRKLFVDAEEEQKSRGDDSDLHIIIFDEIDAICKQRGSVQSSAGVHDTVVNQMLSKMDGVNALNNVLVIGMTNRKELIDDALLRPGRFEVHVEIGLPDEAGRLQILKIHTKKMKDSKYLSDDVDLNILAANTKNFSGAEIEGLVKSASSYAFYGNIDVTKDSMLNVTKQNYDDMKVEMSHFEHALKEVKAAFGVEEEELKKYLRGGFINYGNQFNHLLESCKTLIEQVRSSPRTPLLSILLQGASGCGKTALATFLAMSSQFPYVKLVTAEDMIGWGEAEKAGKMAKVFRDAYKSPLSIIIIDDIERLLEFVPIGPRFSNTTLQALLILLKKVPPQDGRKLLIIGTTSNPSLIDQMQMANAFNVVFNVPTVSNGEEIRTVFETMQVPIDSSDLAIICNSITNRIGIKQLLMVIEMASQNSDRVTAARFFDCLRDCGIRIEDPLLSLDEQKDY